MVADWSFIFWGPDQMQAQCDTGMDTVRLTGRMGGRPKALNATRRVLLYQLYDEQQHAIQELCDIFGIAKLTL